MILYHSLIFFEDFEEFTETSMLDEEVTYTATRLKNPINTWDDFHLVPSTRPVINPPNTRTSEIIIPGRSGSLDLSEVLTGYPLFDNRTGSIEFIVVNGYWNWQVAYSTIMRHLHGKTFKMMLEDDPAYYYEGRFAVNSWKSDKNWSTITIDYNVQPYKMSRQHTSEDWLWDPFSFEDGVIYTTATKIAGKIFLDTEHKATSYIDYGSNHSLTYYPGENKPNITSDIFDMILYGQDNHTAPSVTISGLNTTPKSIRLPCIIYFQGGRSYLLGDALYSFDALVSLTVKKYNSRSEYDADMEPSAIYSTEIHSDGTYCDSSWIMPLGGVIEIQASISWHWKRSDAEFDLNFNFENGIRNGGLYTSAYYDQNNDPVWLSLTNPFGGSYKLNTYAIGDYSSYSDYVTDQIGPEHMFEASAKISIDYQGGIL